MAYCSSCNSHSEKVLQMMWNYYRNDQCPLNFMRIIITLHRLLCCKISIVFAGLLHWWNWNSEMLLFVFTTLWKNYQSELDLFKILFLIVTLDLDRHAVRRIYLNYLAIIYLGFKPVMQAKIKNILYRERRIACQK